MPDKVRLSRPQPVGILPLPLGLLVLPGPVNADAMQRCVEGQSAAHLPESWKFYQDALHGNIPAALDHLASTASPIADYNRFVLDPTATGLDALRASLKGRLRSLVEIAAYTFGLSDDVPSAAGLDGELLALALMTQAAAEIGNRSLEIAIPLLERAVGETRETSPLFAAQLLAQLSAICRTRGEPHFLTLARYRQAIDLLGTAKMPELRSELWMQLGMACQESAMGREDRMTEAVRAYQEVLRSGLAPERHSELFALAHNNLGLLYLSMRMTAIRISEGGNQLHMAIAVQSFREGLRICDRAANPELWASIQLNLANALQYMPSSHPEENLVQAVELYEELVTMRKKAFDPVGYGRILSNQANALAHLGIFSPALEKLNEARKLFEWHNETDLAATAMELAGQIHEQVGTSAGGN